VKWTLTGALAALAVLAALSGQAAAADVAAKGYGALLPSGTEAPASATAANPSGRGASGGLRPSGGGTIRSIATDVSVDDGGVDGSARGTVVARGLTLFDGRVSIAAIRLSARVDAGASGRTVTVDGMTIEGLVVNGAAVPAGPGARVPVEGIGTLVFLERSDTATGVSLNGMRVEVTDPAARRIIGDPFVIGHLELSASAGPETRSEEPPAPPATRPSPPPARTSLGPHTTPRPRATPPRSATREGRTTTAPAPPAPARTRPSPITTPERTPLAPLPRQAAPKVSLGPGEGYVFPVFGEVGYTNDWLAPRAGTGRHYGNDMFADTGTPVVAVADGTLSKVGVNTLGGNRLWLTDDRGNWFYYAHLSAYAPAAVEGARVTRGQVIGFVGNTGQAITTPPHLHFEIRPGGIEADAINPYPHLLAWERGADMVPRAFREGGESATPMPAVGAVVVDGVPENDAPEGPGDGIARPVY
jgi:murein DD-endopeptidase MepM/ murein hydrolase activator NlpD